MKLFNRILSSLLATVMLLSAFSVYAEESKIVTGEEVAVAEKVEDDVIDTEIAEAPSTVTEKGMQFKIDNLEDVKSIRYAYGEYETEREIKYGEDAVSHSGKTLRNKGNSCTLQFTKPGLVSIVVTYNDGTRDFYKYEVIKSEPTVTRDGGNSITFENLNDLKVLRYVKGEYESSYDIKRAKNSVAVSGKTLNSDTYTAILDRETYTFCVQYNDESYNYYVTGVCGDNLTWIYDMQSATLTISGEGEMEDYGYKNPAPWFEYKAEIKNVNVNEGIFSLGDDAFSECHLLNNVSLPLTLKRIGGESFYDCDFLTNIVIPDNVETIESLAFYDCDSLTSIAIPDSVTTIFGSAFKECSSLKSVVIGQGLNRIAGYMFENCSALSQIEFGAQIQIIGGNAFYGCSSLYNIDLPDSVTEILEGAFENSGYYLDKSNWEDELLYLDGHLINVYASHYDTIVIKEGTKTIADCAFIYASVNKIYIPKSVVNIGLGFIDIKSMTFMVYEDSYAHEFVSSHNFNYQIIPEVSD